MKKLFIIAMIAVGSLVAPQVVEARAMSHAQIERAFSGDYTKLAILLKENGCICYDVNKKAWLINIPNTYQLYSKAYPHLSSKELASKVFSVFQMFNTQYNLPMVTKPATPAEIRE